MVRLLTPASFASSPMLIRPVASSLILGMSGVTPRLERDRDQCQCIAVELLLRGTQSRRLHSRIVSVRLQAACGNHQRKARLQGLWRLPNGAVSLKARANVRLRALLAAQ